MLRASSLRKLLGTLFAGALLCNKGSGSFQMGSLLVTGRGQPLKKRFAVLWQPKIGARILCAPATSLITFWREGTVFLLCCVGLFSPSSPCAGQDMCCASVVMILPKA